MEKSRKGFDYVGITVSYMCHDGDGNFVMNKRSANCRDEHGAWDFGGGGLDFGDSVEETLAKEIKEEYCVDIQSFEFLGYHDLFRTINGLPTQWLSMVFLVKVDRSKVQNGEPHKFDDIDWFRLDSLPTPIHSMIPGQLEKFKDKIVQFYKK